MVNKSLPHYHTAYCCTPEISNRFPTRALSLVYIRFILLLCKKSSNQTQCLIFNFCNFIFIIMHAFIILLSFPVLLQSTNYYITYGIYHLQRGIELVYENAVRLKRAQMLSKKPRKNINLGYMYCINKYLFL